MTKFRKNIIITISCLTATILAPIAASGQLQMEGYGSGDVNLITLRYFADELPAGVSGFDLQRRTVMECGSEIILTAIPWIPATGSGASFVLEDANIEPNILYEYVMVPVDAKRQLLEICDVFDCEGSTLLPCNAMVYVSHGPAIFAHAFLADYGWALYFWDSCPASCGLPSGFIEMWLPEVGELADTGQDVQLIGTISWEPGGMEGCLYARAYVAVPTECEVVNERMSWGVLKAVYR